MRSAKLLKDPEASQEIDRDYRTLEMLKQRFGETSFHDCEVMLKDVKNSERVSSTVAEQLERAQGADTMQTEDHSTDPGDASCPTSVLSPMIVSQVFWPQLSQEPCKFPPAMQRALDSYSAEYKRLKQREVRRRR